MDKDHLPLLEDQNPVRRSEIFAGTGSAKITLTGAVKSLSNVSGREADIADCPVEKVLSELSKGRSYLPCLILTV